jgi:hypothetical protein
MSISGTKYWFEGDTLIDNRRYTKVQKKIFYKISKMKTSETIPDNFRI